MTNEEIVLSNISERKSRYRFLFKLMDRRYFCCDMHYKEAVDSFQYDVDKVKNATTIEDRVLAILKCGKSTFFESGGYQCKSGARRSTLDIWAIYKYYFGQIDVFTIMRTLYKLVNTVPDLNTYRCPNIRKRVFWFYEYRPTKDMDVKAELGVPMSEWEHIGENMNEQT